MSASPVPDPLAAPEGAQKALIEAALRLFGTKGYEGTSTRELAALAGVNVALIAYHFGGKEGLRQACGREVGRRMALVAGHPQPAPQVLSPDAALARLESIARGLVGFMTMADGAENMVSFMLHELVTGGPVLDAIYDGFIAPKHAELTALWAAAGGGSADSAAVKLSVFSLIGQVAYFRIARNVVTRRMGWDGYGAAESAEIAEVIVGNLRRALGKGDGP